MSYNPTVERGNAEYRSFIHVPEGVASGITQGSDSTELADRTYANIVYLSNAGDVGTPTASIDSNPSNYSRIIATSGDYTYIMNCEAGNSYTSGDAVWQVKRIDSAGSLMWADGDNNFNNIASGYAGLSYSL